MVSFKWSITFILGLFLDRSNMVKSPPSSILPSNACTESLTKSSTLVRGRGWLSIKCQDPLSSLKFTPSDENSSASVYLLKNHSNTSITPFLNVSSLFNKGKVISQVETRLCAQDGWSVVPYSVFFQKPPLR